MPITEELLHRVRTDKAALDELLIELKPILEERAKSLRPNSLQDDVVQSVLRKILKNQTKVPQTTSHLRAWAYLILRNTWLDKVTVPPFAKLDFDPPDSINQDREVRMALVWAILHLLRDRDRQVLEWTFYDGKSSREIGAALGLKENAVNVLRFNALKRFRKLWEKFDGHQ